MLNELLLSDVKDPRLRRVQVNDVELSGDLGLATVFFGSLDIDRSPEAEAQTEDAFRQARGYLRSRVGQSLDLRRVPELRFVHDESARRGLELSRLIDEADRNGSGEPAD